MMMTRFDEYYSKIQNNLQPLEEEYRLLMMKVLSIPFPAETDNILFYYEVESQIQHVEVMIMDAHGRRLDRDANGNTIEIIFGCDPYQDLMIQWNEDEEDYDETLAEEMQRFVKEQIAQLLANAFKEVTCGSFSYPCYFYDNVEQDAYDLQNRKWIDAIDV